MINIRINNSFRSFIVCSLSLLRHMPPISGKVKVRDAEHNLTSLAKVFAVSLFSCLFIRIQSEHRSANSVIFVIHGIGRVVFRLQENK